LTAGAAWSYPLTRRLTALARRVRLGAQASLPQHQPLVPPANDSHAYRAAVSATWNSCHPSHALYGSRTPRCPHRGPPGEARSEGYGRVMVGLIPGMRLATVVAHEAVSTARPITVLTRPPRLPSCANASHRLQRSSAGYDPPPVIPMLQLTLFIEAPPPGADRSPASCLRDAPAPASMAIVWPPTPSPRQCSGPHRPQLNAISLVHPRS